MESQNGIVLFLVDDDALYLRSLELEFKENPLFVVKTFATGELCLAQLHERPDIIILDYLLDGVEKNAMNGIRVLDRIKLQQPDIPVIMLSAQDRIEVAVNCMHHHAYDYVVKSETVILRLMKIINTIFKYKKMGKELQWYMERV